VELLNNFVVTCEETPGSNYVLRNDGMKEKKERK